MLDAHPAITRAPRLRYQGPLRGVRIVVVAGDPQRTAMLEHALERDGATVAVIDPRGGGLSRARESDPHLVLVDPSAMAGAGTELSRRLDDDPRLRWATIVRIAYRQPWDTIRKDLLGTIALAVEPDVRFATAAQMRVTCSSALDGIGPSRVLRATDGARTPVCIAAASDAAVAEIVVASDLVVSAWWWESGPSSVQLAGLPALSAFLTMRSARVTTMPCDTLDRANLLSPISEALHEASAALDDVLQKGQSPTQHVAPAPPVVVGSEPVRVAPLRPPPPSAEYDEDDYTTERFARALTETEADVVLELRPPTKPSSIAPVSIERARETLGERPTSPWWVLAAAVILLGSVGGAIALQPEQRDSTARPLLIEKSARAKAPPANEPAAAVTSASATATNAPPPIEEPAPAWLDDLPDHPRRAVHELVRRARAIERRDAEEAERVYVYAHELDPRAPRPLAGLAQIALGRGSPAEAAVWAQRAVDASPRRASYRVLLGDALAAQGDDAGAYEAWLDAQRIAPHSRIVRSRLTP